MGYNFGSPSSNPLGTNQVQGSMSFTPINCPTSSPSSLDARTPPPSEGRTPPFADTRTATSLTSIMGSQTAKYDSLIKSQDFSSSSPSNQYSHHHHHHHPHLSYPPHQYEHHDSMANGSFDPLHMAIAESYYPASSAYPHPSLHSQHASLANDIKNTSSSSQDSPTSQQIKSSPSHNAPTTTLTPYYPYGHLTSHQLHHHRCPSCFSTNCICGQSNSSSKEPAAANMRESPVPHEPSYESLTNVSSKSPRQGSTLGTLRSTPQNPGDTTATGNRAQDASNDREQAYGDPIDYQFEFECAEMRFNAAYFHHSNVSGIKGSFDGHEWAAQNRIERVAF